MAEQEKKPTAKNKTAKTPNAKPLSKSILISSVSAIFALSAIGLGLFNYQQQKQSANKAAIHQLQAQQQQLQQQWQDLTSDNQRLNKQIHALLQQHKTKDHHLFKAWQAVANAQTALLNQPNTKLAIAWLTRAQHFLANTTTHTEIKQAITENLTQLKSVAIIDQNQLIQQLTAIQQTIKQLPLVSETATSKTKKTNTGTWWQRVLNSLKSLIIIHHSDKKIYPLISPKHLTILKANIDLKVAFIEWALLNRNNDLYQENLQQIITWLNQFYSHNPTQIKPIITQLNRLKKIDVDPTLPNLQKTLDLFNRPASKTPQSLASKPSLMPKKQVDKPTATTIEA